MAENYYDQASRFAAKLDAVGFLAWLLGLPPSDFTFRGWLDTRDLPFPGESDRASDTVASVADLTQHGRPWAISIEFQVQPDPTMFARMLGYLSGLWLNRRPDAERGSRFHVGGAVVNLTGRGGTSQVMEWPAAGLVTGLTVVERNLEHESADELVNGVEVGRWSRALLAWAPLMAGSDNADLIDRWKALAAAEPDSRRRSELGGLALVFAEKGGCKEIWAQKLEDWNMEESTVVNSWIAKGEARGEARGEIRGEARGKRVAILRFGAQRFGAAPTEVEARLAAVTDSLRLDRITDRILDAAGWDDLLATG